MEKKIFLTIEDVFEKLCDTGAKYWRISRANKTEDFVWSTQKNDLKEFNIDEQIELCKKFMKEMYGEFILDWGVTPSPKTEKLCRMYFVVEEPTPVVEEEPKSQKVANVGSMDYSALMGAFKEQNEKELGLHIDVLNRDYELKGLRRDIDNYRTEIGELKKENENLRIEKENLEKELSDDGLKNIEKFATIAEPYLKMFMMARGAEPIPAPSPSVSSADVNTNDDSDFNLNIPDNKSARFVSAINEWSQTEPCVVEIIEGIVQMKKNEPSLYEMALGKLINK